MAILTKEQRAAMRKAREAKSGGNALPALDDPMKEKTTPPAIAPPVISPTPAAPAVDPKDAEILQLKTDLESAKKEAGKSKAALEEKEKVIARLECELRDLKDKMKAKEDVLAVAKEEARTLIPVERLTTASHDASAARRQVWKNKYEFEEQIISPAIKRKAYTGKIDVQEIPHGVQELIEMLEDSAFAGRNTVNVVKALQRLPDMFERTMWDNPEIVCPGTYLEVETNAGIVRYNLGSVPFQYDDRIMFMMYVIQPTGDARVAIAYLSSSQAAWRLLPDITLDRRLDKGLLGENAYTLPYEVQVVLDKLTPGSNWENLKNISPAYLITSPPEDFDGSRINLHRQLLQDIGRTIIFVDQRPSDLPIKAEPPKPKNVPFVGAVVDADFEGIEKFFRELPGSLWPDFDERNESAKIAYSPIYGDFYRAALLSKDGTIRYVFNITSDGAFFSSIENPLSNINKYGVHENAVVVNFPDDIMTPKCEYYVQFKNGMQPGRHISKDYAKVEGFHDKVPILAEADKFFAKKIEELKRLNGSR